MKVVVRHAVVVSTAYHTLDDTDAAKTWLIPCYPVSEPQSRTSQEVVEIHQLPIGADYTKPSKHFNEAALAYPTELTYQWGGCT